MDEDDAHRPVKRLRQSTRKISKLELEWGELLKQAQWRYLRNNAIAFRLANGCVYWPDWTAYDLKGRQTAWEVKGKRAWDDAIVKIKVAAHEYPETCFVLVWNGDTGLWHQQVIWP